MGYYSDKVFSDVGSANRQDILGKFDDAIIEIDKVLNEPHPTGTEVGRVALTGLEMSSLGSLSPRVEKVETDLI